VSSAELSARAAERLWTEAPADAGVYRDLVLYRRLLAQARPYWPHITGVFFLNLLATPLALLAPVPLKIAVDTVVGAKPLPGFLDVVVPASLAATDTRVLVVAVVLLVTVALAEQLRSLAGSILSAYTGEKLQLEFRSRMFRHIQRLSLAYHDSKGSTDATYRIQYDAPSIQYIAVYGITPFLTAGVTLVGMVAVTASIDWQLAVIALAITPILFGLTWASRTTLRPGWRRTKKLDSSAMSIVQEALAALRVVKAFGQEEREQSRFVSRSRDGMRARVRLAAVEGAFAFAIGATTAVGSAAVLFVGVRHVQEGALTLGSLLLVMAYLLQLYVPLQQISRSLVLLQNQLASAERAFAVLDHAPDVPERPQALRVRRARGAITFERVGFAYPSGPPVLRDVSFHLEPGMRAGIAGRTGSGKSTLVSLLMRFYDPTVGRILLDGVDLREFRLSDLRNQFALVLQDPVLFSTTIAENISYGRPEASPIDVVSAAKAANADEFIEALPDGYDTLVGERGMRLSGGERQRLSLARAFLKDAPILILDEPTSSVDMKTESAIMVAMNRLMRGRTTLMIAHRLSTLRDCDVRLDFDAGSVFVGSGARLGRETD
jgi:ATP-binding cassette subfamily B protein